MRCPFCHNASLVQPTTEGEIISSEDVLKQLQKRRNILEGVCITGGEPLLQPDLEAFLIAVKALGFSVKLDTNGLRPDLLEPFIQKKLIDAVAMDIKNSAEKYAETCGVKKISQEIIDDSISLIRSAPLSYYEFRTTVVKEFHNEKDLESIAKRLQGVKHYFLQSFHDSGDLLSEGLSAYHPKELAAMLKTVQQYIPHAQLRGVDVEG